MTGDDAHAAVRLGVRRAWVRAWTGPLRASCLTLALSAVTERYGQAARAEE
ncbi:hypothetical protein A4R44_04925 [Amycolatopsis sp. M39]|nr:hypothetical protein A4R44_04925 [Amycolatopsis sp. M39]